MDEPDAFVGFVNRKQIAVVLAWSYCFASLQALLTVRIKDVGHFEHHSENEAYVSVITSVPHFVNVRYIHAIS